MSRALCDQLQLQLTRANARLFSLLNFDFATSDANAINSNAEDIAAITGLINSYKAALVSCAPVQVPVQTPAQPELLYLGELPAHTLQAHPVAEAEAGAVAVASVLAQTPAPSQHTRLSTLTREQMEPPPIASFPTEKELRVYCEDWAFKHGYDLVKRGGSGVTGRWRYICGRAGKTQNNRKLEPEQRQRNRQSRKCGCNFKMWIVRRENENEEEIWTIQYYQEMQPHNHDPTLSLSTGVATARRKRRDEAAQSHVLNESNAGVKMNQMLALLRQNGGMPNPSTSHQSHVSQQSHYAP